MQRQREPFFKPLNTEVQSHELSAGHLQSRSRQGEHTKDTTWLDFAVNDEKLTSLHAKLHQEADKIRKWKNQTEIDLKQKDQKILEVNHTVDSLRKSILDLQLQNESLGMTLQEEISNREDILQSMATTRKLCSILKDSITKTEQKVANCEGEKTEIRYQEEEHRKQFELLSDKFKKLEVARNTEHNKLANELSLVTEEKELLKTEIKQKTEEAESKLRDLIDKCDEKDIEIRDIRAEVQKNNEKMHTLEKNIGMLEGKLTMSEGQLNNSNCRHEELCKQFDAIQLTKSVVEDKLKDREEEVDALNLRNTDLQLEIKSCKENNMKELQILQKDINDKQFQLNQKHKKLLFMEKDLEKATSILEDVKSSIDMLIMEKAELENKLVELEKQNAGYLVQHEQSCLTMSQMSNTITELQNQLAGSQQEKAALMLQLNDARTQLSNMETEKLQLDEKIRLFEGEMNTKKTGIVELQNELTEKYQQIDNLTKQMTILQEDLKNEQNNHETTKGDLALTKADLTQSQMEVTAKMKELQKLKKEQDNLTTKNTVLSNSLEHSNTTGKKLKEEITELQTQLALEKETNESLVGERQQNDTALQCQLQTKEKAASDLETKNKTMKSDITTKNKYIRELEKENKGLKLKVTSHLKSLDGKDQSIIDLQTRLDQAAIEKERLMQQFQNLEVLSNKVKEELEIAEKQSKEMKIFADTCVQEKDEMFKQCEGQRNEMSNIMQKYKAENDKLVTKKEKEIEGLKSKIENLKTEHKKENDDKISKLQAEIEQLRKTISDSGYQMESLQKNVGEKETQMIELEKENSKKNEELRDLQQQLEKMYIKQTTTTLVQTSPFLDKIYQRPASKIPTPTVQPRTPKITGSEVMDGQRTPSAAPKTPLLLRTPSSNLKTPQRSILKTVSTNSAFKKRRVVFSSKEADVESNSDESTSFEVMDIDGEKGNNSMCTTPLLLKPSPKPRTPDRRHEGEPSSNSSKKQSTIPLSRTPRGPPVDLEKKQKKSHKYFNKENHKPSQQLDFPDEKPVIVEETAHTKKEKPSSVRKAPTKSAGKFFKNSPKNRMSKFKEKQDMSWFENDDIFGFGCED